MLKKNNIENFATSVANLTHIQSDKENYGIKVFLCHQGACNLSCFCQGSHGSQKYFPGKILSLSLKQQVQHQDSLHQ